jgi:4-amino-4-deoxy-L-arabinose transferase-like glycosyltransferase
MSQTAPVPPRPTPFPAAVALLGWLIPGAGYFLLGERIRAAIIAPVLLALFIAGVLIGGIGVVEAPASFAPASVLDRPWFIGQVLIGPASVAAAITASHLDDSQTATSRSSEIGMLYTAIAGMLNLLAIIDSTHKSVINLVEAEGKTA